MAGFSYIELLVSVAILGLLAGVALPLAETTVKRQKETELRIALREIRQGLDAYKQAAAAGKIAMAPGDSGYPPSLTELAAGVDDVSRPGKRLYFLRRVPADPFTAGRALAAVDTWGKRSYATPPDSPAQGADVFDVYSLSSQTGLNGVPYREW